MNERDEAKERFVRGTVAGPKKHCPAGCGARFYTATGLAEHARLGCNAGQGATPVTIRFTTPKRKPGHRSRKRQAGPSKRNHSEAGREAIRRAANRRRRCDECGLVTGRGPLGTHQKKTGHTGWTDMEPTPEPTTEES